MVLTKEELLSCLRQETRVLVHLASKVEPRMLDFRPTPKQRSTIELLRYLAVNGPTYIGVIERDGFNREAISGAWTAAEERSKAMTFEQAVEAIRGQTDEYDRLLSGWTDEFLRSEIQMFGTPFSRGRMLVMLVLNAHAAYRMQLFLYLKSCGREELGTMNLWAGRDAP